MKCNVGKADRTMRVIVGIAVLGAGLYFRSWWGIIGVILLGTAFLGFCLAYVPFRINTAGKAD